MQATDWINLAWDRRQWHILLNKYSGSITGRKFLSESILVSQERLCFVELLRRYAISTYRYINRECPLCFEVLLSAAKIIKDREQPLMNFEEEG
jgi:hypothetical protein